MLRVCHSATPAEHNGSENTAGCAAANPVQESCLMNKRVLIAAGVIAVVIVGSMWALAVARSNDAPASAPQVTRTQTATATPAPSETVEPGQYIAYTADALAEAEGRVFVFFYAPWCGVCHEKSPVVEALAKEHGLSLERFDIEEADGRAEYERRGLKQIPTLALVRGERTPFRLVGAMITRENVAHLMRLHGGSDEAR